MKLMLKLGLIVVVVSIIIGVVIYVRISLFKDVFSPHPSPTPIEQENPGEVPAEVPTVFKSPKPTPTSSTQTGVPTITTSSTTDFRIKNLEQTVQVLQARLNQLATPSPTTAVSRMPVYIPLGSGGSLGDQGFNGYPGFLVSLNPSDFPGYTNMQLEVTFRIVDGTGTGTVRLFNITDNSGITLSQVSTSANSFILQVSSGFTLPSGTKTYQLQGQSSGGYQLYVQNARIRVNF